jgi:F-box-like
MYPPPPPQHNIRPAPASAPTPEPTPPPKEQPPQKAVVKKRESPVESPTESPGESPVSAPKEKPPVVSPKTPAPVRIPFDPVISRKNRKIAPRELEPAEVNFGDEMPQQPKTTALAILSFLCNEDLYSAGLVCKQWSQLATDKELWNFHDKESKSEEDFILV